MALNYFGIRAIFLFELARTRRTIMQSIIAPVISTSLYFIVFGSAIGSRITQMEGISYGAFIVPGLIMLSLLTQSISNASFGIYFPKFSGTIYELLFVPLRIDHPIWMLVYLILTSVTFSLIGFIIGIWADGFEKLQVVPLLIITPLTFLGGSFYSISVLPAFWQNVALLNPVVYLISGFRWSFYSIEDVNLWLSLGMTIGFLTLSIATVVWIFKTGYRLKK